MAADGVNPAYRELVFDLPVHRWRFMFHDGGAIDVLSACSDSRLNEFAFEAYYGKKSSGKAGPERIVGYANLGEVAAQLASKDKGYRS